MNTSFRIGLSKEFLETSSTSFSFFGNAFLPQKAFVPIGYSTSMEPFLLVKESSRVKEGQLIGRGEATSPFSYIYSSIPGIITGFRDFETIPGKKLHTIEIALQGSFSILGKEKVENEWQSLSPIEIFDKIESSGIIDTAKRIKRPLSFNIKKAMDRKVETLSTALCDFFPSQSLDIFLGEKEPQKIIEGALIIAKILGAKKLLIFHNIKKKKNLHKYQALATAICKNINVEFKKIKEVYPLTLQLGTSFFIDASTSIYTYEAIKNNYPITSIYVSIQGNIIEKPKIFRAKIGAPIGTLIEECGGIKALPKALIINGLTSGYAIKDLDMPLCSDMKSIHLVGKDMLNFYDEMECINCGKCFNSCPCHINPIGVVRAIKSSAISHDVAFSIKQCNSCACCSIVCPSRINLSKIITLYKDEYYKED